MLCIEILVALGTAVLAIVAMPFFDIVTNVMLLNSVSIMSSVLQVSTQCVAKEKMRFIIPSIISMILTPVGYLLFTLSYLLVNKEMAIPVGLAITGSLLVSLNWWENYSTLFENRFLNSVSEDIGKSRVRVCILSSLVRIVVTMTVVGAYIPLSGQDWSSVKSVPDNVRIVIGVLVAVQIVSSALCHWFAVVACKMHILRRSFLVPLYLASIGVLAVFLVPVLVYVQNTIGFRESSGISEFCNNITLGVGLGRDTDGFDQLVLDIARTICVRDVTDQTEIALALGAVACWWLGLLLSTVYIWFLQTQRIERTQDLFVRRLYEGAFMEQSMLLNTRFDIRKNIKQKR